MDIDKIVLEGLSSYPKYLPSWYRYDKQGSILNDICIEQSNWYYFHRFEDKLLKQITRNVMAYVDQRCTLVDLGSGNAMKTRLFIEQMLRKQETLLYLPVDISEEYLKEVTVALQNDYKDTLSVDPVAGEYLDGLKEIKNKCSDDTLILWFGGLQNMSYKDQIKYLSNIGDTMKVNDKLLVTIDTTHPSQKSKIEMAYLDPLGYCGHFVLNSIRRLNNELDGSIDISNFALKNAFVENNSPDNCSGIQLWMEALEECRYDIKELSLVIEFQ